MQKYLQDPLADKILSGEIADGSTVRVDEGDGQLILTPASENSPSGGIATAAQRRKNRLLFRCYTKPENRFGHRLPLVAGPTLWASFLCTRAHDVRVSLQGIRMMRTNLRRQLLATTLLVGVFTPGAAFAQESQSTVPDQSQSVNPNASPASGPVEAQPTPSVSSQGQPVQGPNEIIITGSRIPQPNLKSAAPVTVVNDQDIKLSGSSRIEDVLGQLPSAAATQNGGLSNSATGTAEIDLRYLGAKRSVTLVNGRQLVPGDPNGTTQAADINIIPASILKRVEVLTGGASSVYGADAVAGVVNFIIDTDFSGIRFDGNWSMFQHNQHNPSVGAGARRASAAGPRVLWRSRCGTRPPCRRHPKREALRDPGQQMGRPADRRNGHDRLGLRRRPRPCHGLFRLSQGQSGPGRRARLQRLHDHQQQFHGKPACGGSATAFPGNIFFFPDSGLTTSTTGALGPGTIGVGGPSNIFNYGPLNHFQRPDERYTAGAFANYEINDQIKPYLEFMFMDDRTLAQIAPSGDFFNTTSFNCDNPLIPTTPGSATGRIRGGRRRARLVRARCAVRAEQPGGWASSAHFPVAVGAPYNLAVQWCGSQRHHAGSTSSSPITGARYPDPQRLRLPALDADREGGNRIADLKHTTFRGVLGTRGDLSNVFSYDGYFQYGRVNYEQVYLNEVFSGPPRLVLSTSSTIPIPRRSIRFAVSVLTGRRSKLRPV